MSDKREKSLREEIRAAADAIEAKQVETAASPQSTESSVPRTWKEAIPYIVWVVLVLGFGLELAAALVRGEWLRAFVSGGAMLGVAAAALHWKQIKTWFGVRSPAWVVGGLMLLLAAIILSPFVEQRRLPFSSETANRDDSGANRVGRHLLASQRQKLLTDLNTGPATFKIEIISDASCEECRDYMEDIASVFKQVPGWDVDAEVSMVALPPDQRGLQLRFKDRIRLSLAARTVGNALNAAGIPFDWHEGDMADNSPDAYQLVVARAKK